MLETEFWP